MLTGSRSFTCIFFILFCVSSAASASESGGSDAVVGVVQGTARVYKKNSTKGHVLKKGDSVKKGQEIRVGQKSRIELRFADGTVIRLSEKARLQMSELAFNEETGSKNVKVELPVGKLWAKVKKLATPDSSVEVRTSNAVAGVRGTVYRVNVGEDKSALVKVYEGSVYVASPAGAGVKPIHRVTEPHAVAGPHEVPPPMHEVSMEAWTVIVKAMQQIRISPQGIASEPRDFDPKADADEWVTWNKERDKKTDN